MGIFALLGVILVVGLVVYVIRKYTPLEAPFKNLILWVAIISASCWHYGLLVYYPCTIFISDQFDNEENLYGSATA